MLLSVNRYNFQKEVLESPHLVIVNFWVSWSNECKRMRLLMKELDKQLDEDGKIVEVNWEMEKELARRYKVNGIPCFLVFNKGKLVGRYSGLLNAEEFLQKDRLCGQ